MFADEELNVPFDCIVNGERVRVKGEVDLSTAPKLQEVLIRCTKDIGRIPTIDLSEVVYLDSSGIQALVNTATAHSDEAEMAVGNIIGVQPQVMRILRLVGLDRIYRIYGWENDESKT